MNFLFKMGERVHRRLAGTAVAFGYLLTARPAAAQSLSTLANSIHTTTGAAVDIVGVLMFVVGVMLVVQGLLKFKGDGRGGGEHGEAIKLVAIGVALIALPTFTGIGLGSIFGSGATTVSAASGANLSTITSK